VSAAAAHATFCLYFAAASVARSMHFLKYNNIAACLVFADIIGTIYTPLSERVLVHFEDAAENASFCL
jgi:energy-converting hydrogenase Eha subunit E